LVSFEIFTNANLKPVFIDLGCGPLTSGLAIADLFHTDTTKKINFTYIGIDISNHMIERAKSFAKKDIFVQDHSFYFYNNWSEIPSAILKKSAGSNNPFLINASYLFASTSVNEEDLALFVNKLTSTFKNVHFIFQNPDRTDRNIKWEKFKKHIKFKLIDSGVEEVVYKTSKRGYREPTSEDVYYEILTIFAS
jgi:SAM-dependent methyltransferase